MVRLADLPAYEREHLLGKNLAPLGPLPWVTRQKPLREQRVALITTAGLHPPGADSFAFTDSSYRVLRADRANELVMSHSSVNFDRTGFQEDVNLVLPVDRFRELVEAGRVGSLAEFHYSFMGAGLLPEAYETSARSLAKVLVRDEVDVAFLTPV